jgi:hypothetical protein
MAEFGWAYVKGIDGPTGSILIKKTESQISGSPNLTFDLNNNTVQIVGDLSGSGNVSGSAYYGSGANLTGITLDRVTDLGAVTTNTLTVGGITSSGNVVITGSLTVSGSELVTGNLQVLGSISGPSPVHVLEGLNITGSLRFSGSTANPWTVGGLSSGSANTSSYLALDASNNVILTTVENSIGGTIGAAEDGDYTDGLYTDFTTSTTIGTAIDRFNEILKVIAPAQAPAVSTINYDQSAGETVKLSFDASNTIFNYNAVSTTAGFSAVSRNGIYQSETSDPNFRLGAYGGQELTGTINYTIGASVTNGNVAYASSSFGNAETGDLKLELNGVGIHTVSLSGLTGAGNPATGSATSLTNGSGFVDVSTVASAVDGNGSTWTNFKHRSAKYKIEADDQNKGWNYLRVIHTVSGVNYASNYIEWVNDPEGSAVALTITNPRIEDIVLSGSVFVSGLKYNTSFTANYKALIDNIYRNVYPNGSPVSFSVTSVTNPSVQSVPALEDGENYTKSMPVTGAVASSGVINPSTSIAVGLNVTHPLKANLTNSGSATQTGFLFYDGTPPTSTNLSETFIEESRRIASGSYATQASVTNGAATWNSENHMTASGATGHEDGLLQLATAEYNGRLYSPINSVVPNSGDITALANAASGQPDYSGVTGTRTYFRKIQNTSGGSINDLKITTTKGSTTFNNSSLGTGNIHVYAKIPDVSGWMDISQNFSFGAIADGNGALVSGASNDTDTGNNVHHITFGTASVANNNYVVVKMEADESWAGYLAQMDFQLGASTETAATPQVLSDIDANDTGVAGKLSFGSSNAVSGYSNATGSAISLSDFDSNGNYTVSGNRRGLFSSKPTIDGEVNDAIAADGGSDYPAKAFYNAYTGSLILEVNGSEVHSANLNSSLSTIDTSNSNSSRLNLSAVGYSTTSDSIPNYNLAYRTGTYEIGADDQNIGWNYARLIHRIGASDTTTNYVEWIVDTDSNALASSGAALSEFDHGDVYYQSGVKYFASRPSGSYTYTATNVYRNSYSSDSDAVSFPTTTNSTITNIKIVGSGVSTSDAAVAFDELPALNNSTDCEQQAIEVTGTVRFDQSTSLVGDASYVSGVSGYTLQVNSLIDHPLKANLTTSTLSKTNFLVFSGSLGSTNEFTEEYFNAENYRIVSGNYASQSDISSGAWNSQRSMNDVGSYPAYADGMLAFNSFLISPIKGGSSGDFRNSTDGGSLQSPSSNVNYSTGVLTNATRTYYRYFENNTTNDRSSITITFYGSCTLVNKSTSLGSNNNIHVEAKIPGNTAWLDVGAAYTSNNKDSNGAGALVGGSSPTSISTGGTSLTCTFNGGTLPGTISGEQKVILKISADKNWSGYLTRITTTYS